MVSSSRVDVDRTSYSVTRRIDTFGPKAVGRLVFIKHCHC
jgi:hypothetical protein